MKAAVLAGTLAALTLGGCTTSVVKSRLSTGSTPQKGYATYGIARSMIVVDVVEAKADAPDAGKTGGDKPTDAKATDPKTVTASGSQVDVNLTLSAKSPADPTSKPADTTTTGAGAGAATKPATVPTDADVCAKAKTDLAILGPLRHSLEYDATTLAATLEILGAQAKPADADQKTAVKTLADVVSAQQTYNGKAKSKDVLLAIAASGCPKAKLQVTIVHQLAPMVGVSYVMKSKPDVFYSDTVGFKIDGNGFFTSANTVAKDQSADVAANIGAVVGTFSVPSAGLGSVGREINPTVDLTGNATAGLSPMFKSALADTNYALKNKLLLPEFDFSVGTLAPKPTTTPCDKPGDLKTASTFLTANPACLNNDNAVALAAALRTLAGELAADDRAAAAAAVGAEPLPYHRVYPIEGMSDVNLTFSEGRSLHLQSTCPSAGGAPSAVEEGVVTSSFRGCEVVATQIGQTSELAHITLWAADPGKLLIVPLSRTRFVTRTTTYAFENGRVTSVDDQRDSPAAAFLALPGKFIGGIVGGVVQGYSNQKQVADAKAGVQTSQTTLLANDTALKQAINDNIDATNALRAKLAAQPAAVGATPNP